MYSRCEAGRDSFWLHRELVNRGIDNHVLQPSSIIVDRRVVSENRPPGFEADAPATAALPRR